MLNLTSQRRWQETVPCRSCMAVSYMPPVFVTNVTFPALNERFRDVRFFQKVRFLIDRLNIASCAMRRCAYHGLLQTLAIVKRFVLCRNLCPFLGVVDLCNSASIACLRSSCRTAALVCAVYTPQHMLFGSFALISG